MPPKASKRATPSSQNTPSKSNAGNSNTTSQATKTANDSTKASSGPKKSLLEMVQIVAKCILLALGLTLASISFQEVLHPLYGSIATSFHYRKLTLFSVMASLLLGMTGLGERGALIWQSSMGAHCDAAVYSGSSLVFIGIPALTLDDLSLGTVSNSPAVSPPVVAFQLWTLVGALEPVVFTQIHTRIRPTSILIHLSSAAAISCATSYISYLNHYTTVTPSAGTPRPPPATWRSYLPLVIPLILVQASKRTSPHVIPTEPWTSPGGSVRVLARTDSTTGVVVVAENLIDKFRYLRCDHSLLGGMWIAGSRSPLNTHGLGDSIYTAFVLQEAIRIVERPDSRKEQDRSLIIGLGVGVAAGALQSHGSSVTVVEIDPAVYNYAREYFGLPEPNGGVFLEDARGWVDRRARTVTDGHYTEPGNATQVLQGATSTREDLFDYIIHDCFSGGSVPTFLFSTGFFEGVKRLLKTDGVLAVNFAGKLGSDPAHAILNTLLSVFDSCRVFHDKVVYEPGKEPESGEHDDFLNMVYFCNNAPALKFRDPVEKDFLGSFLRQHILTTMDRREVTFDHIRGNATAPVGKPLPNVEGEARWVLKDGDQRLGEWQKATGLEHWKVMRHVMADEIWESY
ncbi:spermine/spermidine synthase [Rhizoctonia solani]|uniref:Spermine/spermidine synthase n=1 Tax=Rhizoctonia solani TaxID=456999 RepID=A0A8H8P4B8_9AGAM|nr:spermine/spermidine synthase [Rhizoctonia solani]QRW25411.1 spermine/spermidine synthase [Rhizoctonia solani]